MAAGKVLCSKCSGELGSYENICFYADSHDVNGVPKEVHLIVKPEWAAAMESRGQTNKASQLTTKACFPLFWIKVAKAKNLCA